MNEIDIEIVPDYYTRNTVRHDIPPPAGWTDARFNAWGNSVPVSLLPETYYKQPVKGIGGKPISLMDSCFHVYTIRWLHFPGGDGRSGQVDLYIDGVHQQRIKKPVPDANIPRTPAFIFRICLGIAFRARPIPCNSFQINPLAGPSVAWFGRRSA